MKHFGDITRIDGRSAPIVDVDNRRKPLPGFKRGRQESRLARRTERLVYGTNTNRKGDEKTQQ